MGDGVSSTILAVVAYGVVGWAAEIVWTASYALVSALRSGTPVDRRLAGRTYLWMFPVYGLGGLAFEHVHGLLAAWPWVLRGAVYMVGCFAIEAASGLAIKAATGKIPWDYSYARWQVGGVIRLDYVPVWFGFGLFLELVERVVARL